MSNAQYLASLVNSSGNINIPASNAGINFNNSSAIGASTLNDYETGTWTPIAGSGLTTTGTAAFYGTYTKIGNLVRINFRVTATTIACAAATVLVGNVPIANNQDGTGNFGSGLGLSGNYNYVYQVYSSVIYAYTTITGINSVYGSIVYQANF